MAVPVVVQTKGDTTFRASPISLAFASSNTAGNVLVATAWVRFLTGTPTVTDTQGNTWVLQSSKPLSESGQVTSLLFICSSCASGSNTVTLAFGGGNNGVLNSITEISGSAGVVDQIASGHAGASPPTPYNSGSITTTQVDSIVIASFQVGLGGFADPVIASPFTRLSNAPTGATYAASGYVTESSTGTYNAQIDHPGDDPSYIIFNLYAGGAPPPPPPAPRYSVIIIMD